MRMLLMVCGLAACVALLGGLGDAEEPVSQAFLALKAELQSTPAAHVSGKVGAALPPACASAPVRPRLAACSPAHASRLCAGPLTLRGSRAVPEACRQGQFFL
jgi:hypothetical protein